MDGEIIGFSNMPENYGGSLPLLNRDTAPYAEYIFEGKWGVWCSHVWLLSIYIYIFIFPIYCVYTYIFSYIYRYIE